MTDNEELFDRSILRVNTAGIKPTITQKDVSFDDEPITVADPFLVYQRGKFFIFYEVLGKKKKVIGVSSSSNGKDYEWLGVALDESPSNILLSFPYVFQYENSWYMIPEQSEINTCRSLNYLYKTDNENFPFGWKREGVLFQFDKEDKITDKAIFRHNGMWYIFYGLGNSRRHKLCIAMFENLKERKVRKHPFSPIIQTPANNLYSKFIFYLNILAYKLEKIGFNVDNFRVLSKVFSKLVGFVTFYPCRPGGKIIKTFNGKIIVYLQNQGTKLNYWDIRKSYGRYISAMIIDKLTPKEIAFQLNNSYVIAPTFKKGDWNAEKMHMVCPVNVNGEIFVAVDGYGENEWSIAVIKI